MLRTVRTGTDDADAFVPRISVTVAYGLAVISVIGLVYFLARLAATIRVESVLRSVHDDAPRWSAVRPTTTG